MSVSDWVNILDESWRHEREVYREGDMSRLEYIGESIFDFTTYDSGITEKFAAAALAVCEAINEEKTFEFIKDEEDYLTYLLMVNMPFFKDRLEWGCSIRGAWWNEKQELITCGITVNGEQVTEWSFSRHEWEEFIRALIEFSEMTDE